MRRFSKKAQTHAAQSKQRTRRMVKSAARRAGPVKVYYLPGFGPPSKFPFRATINGERATVNLIDGKVVFTYDPT